MTTRDSMMFSCEVMVQEILPGLRAMIARELAEEYNMNQNEIASSLGVSQPAISQYVRALRGRKLRILTDTEILAEIKAVARNIHEQNVRDGVFADGLCRICRLIAAKKLIETTYNGPFITQPLCALR